MAGKPPERQRAIGQPRDLARFDAGAAAKLAELLQAVAAFAVGGVNALADLRTDGARRLLNQMK
jgi:hypothetical protein